MLRNCAKITLCGIIITAISGCQNTTPLFKNNCDNSYNNLSFIKIKAPSPWMEHHMHRCLVAILGNRSENLKQYKIKINIKEYGDVAAFSEKEVVKEEQKLVAHLQIFDKKYVLLQDMTIDSYTTYDVSDSIPFATLSEKHSAYKLLIKNLSNEIGHLLLQFGR